MIETTTAYISLIENDILRIEYKADTYIDLKEFEENMSAYKKLLSVDKAYLLTVAGPGAEPSPEVRENFSSSSRSAFKIAEAMVLTSLAHKILANFVVKVQKPVHPLKFFNNEQEALTWLLGLRNKEPGKQGTANNSK